MKPASVRWTLIAAAVLVAVLWLCVSLTAPRRSAEKATPVEVPQAAPGAGIPTNETTVATPAASDRRVPATPPPASKLGKLLPNGRTRGTLSRPVIERFLESAGRNAATLLVAWRESRDRAFLAEAAANFPDDPRVQFAKITDPDSAAERDAWIEAFQRAAPENALPDYFAAIAAFDRDDTGLAASLLAQASRKGFADYTWETADETEALLLAGGVPRAEAKAMAMFTVELPHLAMLRQLGERIGRTQASLRDDAKPGAADELLEAQLQLGSTLSSDERSTLIHRLVGIAIERDALRKSPMNSLQQVLGRVPAERSSELEALRKEILESTKAADITAPNWSEDQIVRYLEISRAEGEIAAQRWLVAQGAAAGG